MSKRDKALKRLLLRPTDYQWSELKTLMAALGYKSKVTGGSGRKFVRGSGSSFMIHEPHPHNLLKAYQIKELLRFLQQEGDLQ